MSEQPPTPVRLHVIVEGRVQGVGYRAFVEQAADAFGLNGWVRNRWDGSVEVTAEGPRPVLERFLHSLGVGPRMANVTTLLPEWLEASGEFAGFAVRRSA
ncbi:MAG: acylphosphatase [Chloroflexota bacterium]